MLNLLKFIFISFQKQICQNIQTQFEQLAIFKSTDMSDDSFKELQTQLDSIAQKSLLALPNSNQFKYVHKLETSRLFVSYALNTNPPNCVKFASSYVYFTFISGDKTLVKVILNYPAILCKKKQYFSEAFTCKYPKRKGRGR